MNTQNDKNNNLICKGQHCLVDFTGVFGDQTKIGNFVFNLMIKAIERTSMKIIHKHLEILSVDTPPGFTSGILLLDSSHFTSHCYSDLGIIAMDIFTCSNGDGDVDVLEIMTFVKDEMIKEFPKIKCTYMKNHKRFHH